MASTDNSKTKSEKKLVQVHFQQDSTNIIIPTTGAGFHTNPSSPERLPSLTKTSKLSFKDKIEMIKRFKANETI